MEKHSIYLETTVISYYTSRPSRDIIILAHQEITKEWWDRALGKWRIFISQMVIEEVGMGDPESVKKRLEALKDFSHLELNEDVEKLAELYVKELRLPKKALRDAVHLAVATVHQMEYLVTWNCKHMANGEIVRKLSKINSHLGIDGPVICTPEELMG